MCAAVPLIQEEKSVLLENTFRNIFKEVFFCLAWKESVVVRAYKSKCYYKSILKGKDTEF